MEGYILNIETATYSGSLSLGKNGEPIAVTHFAEGEKHIKSMAPAVSALLHNEKLKVADLAAVAISSGPGSYTGLRIATSFAKGICTALNIPLIAVPTLDILAHALFAKYPEADYVVPLLDARRMEVYTATYHKSWQQVVEKVNAVVINEKSFEHLADKSVVFGGNGTQKTAEVLQGQHWIFDKQVALSAANMCKLSEERQLAESFEDLMHFEPFYLKEFVVGKASQKIAQILRS
ncbi:tRNA (adenosine(37)-N6)-threonylcarbamoyltransferase complex dimerization subunit type 1 TsaB [bacterium]|nr:tRNA (adenosine(37)-N6)-threonylcarbamoyltransferase complex dimerization subunit type 1 TsaB [bacterium]